MTSLSIEVEQEFLTAMQAAGLDYNGPIIADDQLHRVKINGDHNPNSWYILHLDGLPAGSFGCWPSGSEATI